MLPLLTACYAFSLTQCSPDLLSALDPRSFQHYALSLIQPSGLNTFPARAFDEDAFMLTTSARNTAPDRHAGWNTYANVLPFQPKSALAAS